MMVRFYELGIIQVLQLMSFLVYTNVAQKSDNILLCVEQFRVECHLITNGSYIMYDAN